MQWLCVPVYGYCVSISPGGKFVMKDVCLQKNFILYLSTKFTQCYLSTKFTQCLSDNIELEHEFNIMDK